MPKYLHMADLYGMLIYVVGQQTGKGRKMDIEKLLIIANSLDSLADKLDSCAAPGHVDYISKHRAAEWARRMEWDLRRLVSAENNRVECEKHNSELKG